MPAPHSRTAFVGRSSTRRLTQEVAGSGGEKQASFAMKTSLRVIALTVAFSSPAAALWRL